MSHRDKRPVAALSPSSGKTPTAVSDPTEYRSRKIAWRVGKIDLAHAKWGGKIITGTDWWQKLHGRLKNLESMTWAEIEKDRHSHAFEVRHLCKDAQDRLLELKLQTIDTLYQIHVNGPGRLWGIREGALLSILWWDPNHTVYPTEKKNT